MAFTNQPQVIEQFYITGENVLSTPRDGWGYNRQRQ